MHITVGTESFTIHTAAHHFFLMRSLKIDLPSLSSQGAYVAIVPFTIPTAPLTLYFLFSLIIAILVNTKWYFTAF